ncbi:MAG: hypothetical protein AB1611_09395 [bacterium]
MQPLILNKVCRYCPYCDLIIARKSEVKSLMWATFEKTKPEIVGHEYLVLGTVEKADWRQISKTELPLPPRDYIRK